MAAQLENGYTKIANEILDHIARTKLNGSQFRIVMAIFRYTYGFNRKEHPMSIGFLAEATDMNRRQVQRELTTLIDAGIIKIVKESTFSSPAVLSFNKYFDQWCLNRQQVTEQTTGDGTDNQTDVGLDVTPGDGLDVRGDVGLDTQEIKLKDNIKENPKENITPRSPFKSKKQEQLFDQFWDKYPKKKSKGQAEKAWLKIDLNDLLFKRIMAGVEQARGSPDWIKDKGQYIPYPATWLNAKGWEDEYGEPVQGEEESEFDWGWTKT